MALLLADTLPHIAAILHCKEHQKGNTFTSISHNLTGTTAKQAAQQMTSTPGHSTNSL
jgi:hypothetical protein